MGKNKGKKVIQLPTSPENYIRTRARLLPIGKCYINEGWAESGFASIVVSRNHINGNFTFAVYLVDLYCLGVKDTFYDFNVNIEFTELLNKLKKEQNIEEIDYTLAHNIIYGGVEYAEDIGFKPHKDFEISRYVLEEDDEHIELIDIQFGLDGKPAIVIGKEKHPANIIATLERTVGKGNYIIITEEDEENISKTEDWGKNDDDMDEDDDELDKEDFFDYTSEDITAVLEQRKEASPRNFARIVFSLYQDQKPKKEVEEMFSIIEKVDEWEVVEEWETDDPTFADEKNESVFNLIAEKVHNNPEATIPEIKEKIDENPGEYYFYNLLAVAYSMLDDTEKEREVVISTYKKFPKKIMAFVNYVKIESRFNNDNALKKLIGNEFDFHHFFPHRNNLSFHELISLTASLLIYFSQVRHQSHKGIAYVIATCSFIFYHSNKSDAYLNILAATNMMIAEMAAIEETKGKK